MNSIDRRLAKLQAKASRQRAAERERDGDEWDGDEQCRDITITLTETPYPQTKPDDDPDYVRISKVDLDRLTAAANSLAAAAKLINRRGR